MMACVTKCPECGQDGELVLLNARIYPQDTIYIQADGFVIEGSMDTEDEQIECRKCGWHGFIQYVEDK